MTGILGRKVGMTRVFGKDGESISVTIIEATPNVVVQIKKREKEFPFIVLIPQAETKGWGADGPNAKRALAMLDEVMKEYKTDAKRQYLTGLSMGGAGTWSVAAAHPDRWAAIVPICGPGDSANAGRLVHPDPGHADSSDRVGEAGRRCAGANRQGRAAEDATRQEVGPAARRRVTARRGIFEIGRAHV